MPAWVKPAITVAVFLITVALGYWQLKRDERKGVFRGELPLRLAMVFCGQGICAVGAVALLSEGRSGGTNPEAAVSMAILSIVVQAMLFPRLRGRAPEMIGLLCSFLLASFALGYAYARHLR